MIVSITRLRLRRWFFLPRFAIHALRSRRQAASSPGFVCGCFAVQPWLVFWTITVWKDDQAMRSFRNNGDHGRSMRYLMHWCDEASYVHFPTEEASLPTAASIFERLRDEGKLSKVLKPSPAHAAGELAGLKPPRLTGQIKPSDGQPSKI